MTENDDACNTHRMPSLLIVPGDQELDDDPQDIVKTQGRFLQNRPPTPVHWKHGDPTVISRATEILRLLADRAQPYRVEIYGQAAADEWPIGRTPPHVREAYEERAQLQREYLLNYVTPSTSATTPEDKPEDEKENEDKSARNRTSPKAQFASPPSSFWPPGRKRRHAEEENENEPSGPLLKRPKIENLQGLPCVDGRMPSYRLAANQPYPVMPLPEDQSIKICPGLHKAPS
jgi:hypothetical protein